MESNVKKQGYNNNIITCEEVGIYAIHGESEGIYVHGVKCEEVGIRYMELKWGCNTINEGMYGTCTWSRM